MSLRAALVKEWTGLMTMEKVGEILRLLLLRRRGPFVYTLMRITAIKTANLSIILPKCAILLQRSEHVRSAPQLEHRL
jgi:hypothetical protein